jgi:hypothetical protein
MNLRRHLNVLRRFRLIVIGGLLVAVALAVLSVFRVSTTGISWRSTETFQSESTLNVTQQGFPDGRVVLGGPTPGTTPDPNAKAGEAFADPSRFANLAITYAYYSRSAAVRDLIKPRPSAAQITVAPVPAAMNSSQTLPILTLTTTSTTAESATKLNADVVDALRGYIKREQDQSGIKSENRVRVDVLSPPSQATVLLGHSKTPAVVAFVLVMALALALAYCLDNLYPREPVEPEGEEDRVPVPPVEDFWPTATAPAETRQAS